MRQIGIHKNMNELERAELQLLLFCIVIAVVAALVSLICTLLKK